ncbi:MAG: hypothetical protein ACKO9H_19940, partial [Planctomycetota bacterium]
MVNPATSGRAFPAGKVWRGIWEAERGLPNIALGAGLPTPPRARRRSPDPAESADAESISAV